MRAKLKRRDGPERRPPVEAMIRGSRALTMNTESQLRWRRRNPPAAPGELRHARATARAVAREYAARGATAVVLGGSWARADAHRHSDIDLWVFGLRPATKFVWRDSFFVAARQTTVAGERRRMREPSRLGAAVPAWRHSILLYDRDGIAHRLKREAIRFRWAFVDVACDRWVADQMVAWGEEAVKLVRALAVGSGATAAVQRNLLAEALGFVVAVHRRTFWESENEFWERIGQLEGGAWQKAQTSALGADDSGLEESCRAALDLFTLTAARVGGTLSRGQAAVAREVCRVAGTDPGKLGGEPAPLRPPSP